MKFIIKLKSTHLVCWGRYNLYKFNEEFFVTKKSYICENTEKEVIVMAVPKFMIAEVLNKKHIDSRYINKMRTLSKIKENENDELQKQN